MPENRSYYLDKLKENADFDVVVVGGGINGVGVFRDLSLQGLRVLLVERNDFCSGCSAAPSRMIHGGLRYLENGEFGLVRESLTERDALLRNAPHMVRPLKTVVPIRTLFSGLLNGAANFLKLPSKPAERGVVPIKIGLSIYDWVTRKGRLLPKHSLAKVDRNKSPLREDFRFVATYFDAWISYPERLAMELIQDALRDNRDSVALNYCTISAVADGSLQMIDQVSNLEYLISAKAIVNATGAWLDETTASLSAQQNASPKLVEGTKGSHLVLDHPELEKALDGNMVFFENADGRVCIVFPYCGRVLVGSTDIRVTKATRTRCGLDEQSYILKSLKYVFPKIVVRAEDVVFSYSGIRPLPKSDQAFTGRISRSHFVHEIGGKTPQFCMVGGKWTTFRAFAEQTSDRVLRKLGVARKSSTLHIPIGGGQGFDKKAQRTIREALAACGMGAERIEHLIDHYGADAKRFAYVRENERDDSALGDDFAYSTEEIRQLTAGEFAVHLSDIVLRRTSLAITGKLTYPVLTHVAQTMSSVLGWDEAQTDAEISSTVLELQEFHGVDLSTS